MNIKLLIALSFSLLLAACGKANNTAATTQHALIKNCIQQPQVPCRKNDPKNKVKVIANAANPMAVPPTVCSAPGATIEVEVVQGRNAVTVVAVPKDAKNGWILATNVADPTKMTITVPPNVETGKDYDYLFITSRGKCADPRIRID